MLGKLLAEKWRGRDSPSVGGAGLVDPFHFWLGKNLICTLNQHLLFVSLKIVELMG